ncbi:SRPBCC family protein [Lysinibacillus sp. 2017]|uniref:CoxG family protein n=1 Tax=unclassified Lysinibacillus TaxID=2636778 RepID=UPI000D52791C|nr:MULTISPECIES: SRPBCC family protein [unclassified Lysinibacillus]AWE08392.1 SRPBCC family protein [Lysinibacillus sp. 2017]TGN35761.1 SRPBCC family protein [Lysinibacillus sp. S2017]
MAQASHSVQIPVSQDKVWSFVSKIEKWATLVPAYKEHKDIDAQTSIWTFEGSFKGLTKKVEIEIKIVEMNEPTNIKFEIKGLSDNIKGGGEFKAEPKDGGTYMTATVEVTAGGLSGAVLTPAIKVLLPKVTTKLTEKIARHIQA